ALKKQKKLTHKASVDVILTSAIRKRSKTTGVLVTQYVTTLPEGKSTPDFQCKPAPVTTQAGKLVVFKAVVKGDPKPEVSWRRAKGNLSDKDKYHTRYDESTDEYILEVMSAADIDTYKCYAVNEYGKAICTAALNVKEGKNISDPLDFRKLLKKSKIDESETKKEDEDERFWDAMINADKKDYERICTEFGVADMQRILQKLEHKKRERANKVRIKPDGVIPQDKDATEKYRTDVSNNHPKQNNKGLNQEDVEDADLLPADFKLSDVDFVIRIQEIKAVEREDALFECVLTHPLPRISWMGKGSALQNGEKYSITVSDHKLIHRLLIKDCKQQDKGIYSAVAGITSCSAWLIVEADRDPASAGTRKLRKTTLARGGGPDLEKAAREQQIKYREEMEKILASVKAKHATGQPSKDKNASTNERDGEISAGKSSGAGKDRSDTSKGSSFSEQPGFICGLSDVNAIIGETAELTCKLSSEDCEGAWFRDGKKVSNDDHFIISQDGVIHTLVINTCMEEHSGKYRFEADGRKTEAMVNVKDPPRFDREDLSAFIQPVSVKVGHNAIFKLAFVGHQPIKIQWYREGEELQEDNNIKMEKSAGHSRLVLSRCHRKDTGEIKIKLKNEDGFTEAISQLIVLDKPSPPMGPAEVTESSAMCIEFKWRPPKDDGGSPVTNYTLERQQVGRNTWKKLGEIPGIPSYNDTDVDHGRKYCYRIRAVTAEGVSEAMETDDMQAGTLAFPGPPAPPKVVSAYDDCINLSWAPPSNTGGSRILGYILEKRKKGSNLWTVVNALGELIKEKTCAVKDVVAGMEYEFRVTAINLSGTGEFSAPSEYVFARDPKMRPKFTNHKMKSFVVVRAGNSVRITLHFEASPRPNIMWLKDNVPVAKRVTISNSDGSSQLLIPSSERSDSGIYSILVKNLVGQETFSTEVRVTDDPKPPGPVELEENVPGTVTVMWEPSPDEKRDDRLHYTVSKLDSTKRTWATVGDRLFNNKCTVCNIMPGREYHFRVYAKNDMGISAPSESPTWGKEKKKDCDLRCAPTFIVPLKLHTAPKGYECYMSCAVNGNPKPRITWYRNNISLNTNTNYYISNTCGVCSMLILQVGPKDMGEYVVTAENALGRAECSTVLSVRGEECKNNMLINIPVLFQELQSSKFDTCLVTSIFSGFTNI
uniref:Immunoglobulin like and fibronectin type III domain containing 1, tandem duplicate 3 n=1 Tax=Sphaeramia orbicularis TaxID=375764 RepID=A0A672YVD5_9TELE